MFQEIANNPSGLEAFRQRTTSAMCRNEKIEYMSCGHFSDTYINYCPDAPGPDETCRQYYGLRRRRTNEVRVRVCCSLECCQEEIDQAEDRLYAVARR